MARDQWIKQQKNKIYPFLKEEIETKVTNLIETVLRPAIIVRPSDYEFNYVVDIYTKWHGHHYYIFAKYCCPSPDATMPGFESGCARMAYVGGEHFNLAYFHYSGKWAEIFHRLTIDECIDIIKDDPGFQPSY
jgi:hypothetical protein